MYSKAAKWLQEKVMKRSLPKEKVQAASRRPAFTELRPSPFEFPVDVRLLRALLSL
jgi:hypothetical protein